MKRIGQDIERELARSGVPEVAPLASITRVWTDVVGEAVARNAWPARLARDGTLHVATSSSTWAFELESLSPEIEGRLRTRLGEDAPAKLRFRVGTVPEIGPSQPAPSHAREVVELPPELAAAAAAAASAIDDPDLRELVARAARASLGRSASDRRF